MDVHTYKDLKVWQKAVGLSTLIYELTNKFSKDEMYGLSSQMRRAAVSIASNIAEGKLRGSGKEFRQFLLVAYGSAGELETQIEICKRLQHLKDLDYQAATFLLGEVMRMLNALIRRVSVTNAYRLKPKA